jgi:ATP-dependent Clp protease ATP-binding subunit ClpC
MNGYNFTEENRRVLMRAREEAFRLHHDHVGTEHVLISLLREESDTPARVLRSLGAAPADVIAMAESRAKTGNATIGGPDLPYASRTKKVLELAMKEARQNNRGYVGTEHLLVGLLAEERGIGAQALTDHGVTLARTRAEIVRQISSLGNVSATLGAESRPQTFARRFLRWVADRV